MTKHLTRLAPSPTGALHLGNARTFLINWAIARNENWSIILRIEDLDGPRTKEWAAEQTLRTLAWLGIDYDGEPLYQTVDLKPYQQAMQQLAAKTMTYACELTRKEIDKASSAPHGHEHELRYAPELRPSKPDRFCFDQRETNYRLIVDDEWITIDDRIAGPHRFNPHREVGDFVIWTKRGMPAYQLAVVVDDARQGVTDVIRGADLLPSTARQELVYRALGLRPPRWWHLPLVIGEDGKRLAKRHGDTRLDSYRQRSVRPERIIGLLAAWSGVFGSGRDIPPEEMNAEEFRRAFDVNTLPRIPIVFTEKHHRWLLRQ